MALTTRSKFYYGHTITRANRSLDFNEGGPELQATLTIGNYSLNEFVIELQNALNAAGSLTYTVTVNRNTRIITIAATGNFTLLAGTGSRVGTGVWALAGFNATDLTGTNIYNSQNASGSVFLPQHLLIEHIDAENFQRRNDVIVQESASGKVQTVFFGIRKFFQFNIVLQTNLTIQTGCQPQIEYDANGVDNLREFMEYITTKAKFEFMPDRDQTSIFFKVILEQTAQSRSGTDFTLLERELAPGYFDTGRMVLRIVD